MPMTSARKVKQLIRELCHKALETGGGTARDVAETALQMYPQECHDLLNASLVEHLTRLARDVFKELQETAPTNGQPLLPGFPEHFYRLLPVSIAIPRQDGAMVYKALFGPHRATQDELQAGIEALTAQIERDTRRRDALQELWTYREYRGGDA